MITKEILERYVTEGWLYKQVHPTLPLTIYNYSQSTQYEGKWDEVTLACRGLVLDEAGKIVARPFGKFFNMEEGRHTPTSSFEVFEKMDGSLGIMFLYNGQLVCSTRGSFTSEQSEWMSNFVQRNNYRKLVSEGYTYMFEILYPQNRIVVDYGDAERLVLLGVNHTQSGDEVPYSDLLLTEGWDLVDRYDGIYDYQTLKGMVRDNAEGFVVRFSNGSRMKIKGEEYLRLHRVMTNLSTTAIWEVLANGGSMEGLLADVPDEFYSKIKTYEDTLRSEYVRIEGLALADFQSIEVWDGGGEMARRRDFAKKAKQSEFTDILFRMVDGKSYSHLIWKRLRPDFLKM
jgi:T4 RnlA family RNA ligase